MGLSLQLETTSTCNAKCHFCVYPEAERWGGVMSWDLFTKIVDEAATIHQITDLILHGLGEPLLDPMLERRIAYHKNLSSVPTCIFTNGVYLTPDRFDRLVKAGLDKIVVSLNAVRSEQHEEIMGLVDKFDTVCANLEYAMKDGIDVEAHAVINGDKFTEADAIEFKARWGGLCVVEGNWAGDTRTIRPFKPNEHCFRATGHIYVLYDGRISTCCFDPTGKMILGDLSKQSIREAYNAGPYLKFREDHFNDRADIYPICKNCTRI